MTYFTEFGMQGPGGFASVCHIYKDILYIYDPYDKSEEASNFGSIQCLSMSNERKLKRKME